LIGAVEYGIEKLPHASKTLQKNDPASVIKSLIHVQRRQTSTSSADGTSATNPNAYVATTSPSSQIVSYTMTSNGYVPPETPSSSAGGYVPTIVGTTDGYVPTPTPGLLPQSSYVPTTTPIAGAPPSGSYAPTTDSGSYVAQTHTTSTTVSTTIVTSFVSSIVTTDANGRLTTEVTFIPTTTTGLATVETAIVGASSNVKGPLFPMWLVFVGNYLALIVVVLFRQFWTAIYSQTKLIEPFMLLSQGRGVSAGAVLDSFYLSSNLTPDPLLALARRHWFVLWTSLVYFAVVFLGPLSSEFLFLDTNYENCPFRNDKNTVNPCWPPQLSIDPTLARVVEGLLTYTAIMTLTIIVMMMRAKTGIYSDPSSIGSVTSLVHHPEVVEDFRTFHEEASMKEIKEFLGNKMYKLGEYQRSDGVWRYGLMPAVPTFKNYGQEVPTEKFSKPKNRRWKVIDLIFDTLFFLCLLGLLGVVAAYYKDGSNDGFNRFFNSRSFGPRFVLTGVGTLIAVNWKRLERGK
jgi:uncharacterized protein DUF3433